MNIKTSLFLVFLILNSLVSSAYAQPWTQNEIAKIQQFSLQRLPPPKDPSNKYLNDPNAIEFGKTLFNDTRLSRNQKISCATCHIENKAFTDNKNLAIGLRQGFRNTPSLLNVTQHHWFFADGAKDSLWAQAISSLENPAEQGFTRIELLHLLSSDSHYKNSYEEIFDDKLPLHTVLDKLPERAGPNGSLAELVAWKKLSKKQRNITNKTSANIGKAIAAYVSTLSSTPTRFDQFAEELQSKGKSNILTNAEQKGLSLFLSREAACANCHSGPFFSNKEFHNIATGIGGQDNGRSEVLETVIRDIFNCLGEFSDAKREECVELNYINRNKHQLKGAFKTSSLRNISKTGPYMHDGRFDTLDKVIEHYNKASQFEPNTTDLNPINLSKAQQAYLIQFLLIL